MNRRSFLRAFAVAPLAIPAAVVASQSAVPENVKQFEFDMAGADKAAVDRLEIILQSHSQAIVSQQRMQRFGVV